jgi:hypothetical protein
MNSVHRKSTIKLRKQVDIDLSLTIQRTPKAVARFLRTQTEEAWDAIVRLCRANCHGLFLSRPGDKAGEGRKDFITMWLAKKIQPLLNLSQTEIDTWEQSGVGDYWSYDCRLAFLQKIARHRRAIEISLDAEESPLLNLWACDGSGCSWVSGHETQVEPKILLDYIEDNLTAFQALGKMGDVLIAALKVFPDTHITRSISDHRGVTERQARRHMKILPEVLQMEIAAGNPVIRGLFNLLQNGTSTLAEHRRPWDFGPYMAFSPASGQEHAMG